MIASHKHEFGVIEIYSNYIIAIMNEGIVVKPEYNNVLLEYAEKYFSEKPFGYITHRINSYAVDPSIYFETSKIENLAAFAVVSNQYINISNTQLEKIFLKKPFEHFFELDDAIEWVNNKISAST